MMVAIAVKHLRHRPQHIALADRQNADRAVRVIGGDQMVAKLAVNGNRRMSRSGPGRQFHP